MVVCVVGGVLSGCSQVMLTASALSPGAAVTFIGQDGTPDRGKSNALQYNGLGGIHKDGIIPCIYLCTYSMTYNIVINNDVNHVPCSPPPPPPCTHTVCQALHIITNIFALCCIVSISIHNM